MTHQQPVEPSAVLTRDGTPVALGRRPTRWAGAQQVTRALVPAAAPALTAGLLLTASAVVVSAAAAAKVAEAAARMVWPTARREPGTPAFGSPPLGGAVQITWTQVEIRWRP